MDDGELVLKGGVLERIDLKYKNKGKVFLNYIIYKYTFN